MKRSFISRVTKPELRHQVKPLQAPAQARDPEANRRLWQISERLTGLNAT